MRGLLICVCVLFCSGVFTQAQQDYQEEYPADYFDSSDFLNEPENKETDQEGDSTLEKELERFRKQFNRSDDDDKDEFEVDFNDDEETKAEADKRAQEAKEDYALLWGDGDIEALQPEEPNTAKETKNILENEEKETNDFADEIKSEDQPLEDEFVDETRKLLAEMADVFEVDQNDKDNNAQEDTADIAEEPVNDNNEAEEDERFENSIIEKEKKKLEGTKIYWETNDAFDDDQQEANKNVEDQIVDDNAEAQAHNVDNQKHIEETKQILEEDTNDDFEAESPEIVYDYVEISKKVSDIRKYLKDDYIDFDSDNENQNDESQDEDTVNKVMADLDADLKSLVDTIDRLSNYSNENKNELDDLNSVDNAQNEAIDSNLSDIFAKNNEDDVFKYALGDPTTTHQDAYIMPYINDELMTGEIEKEAENINTKSTPEVFVDDLDSGEMDNLMTQFAIAHKEDVDVDSPTFARNIAAIHIKLSVDEPVEITSPNYPGVYPTNNIIDWIFEGDGEGIEFTITDFAINGALGDYLLVKPGGLDETGSSGLLFSYRLNEPRRYRFMDVDKMFVRFDAKMGMAYLRGFKFSVRQIRYKTNEEASLIPNPEAVVEPPEYTYTVHVGGLTLDQFRAAEEQFRVLVADMAEEYIADQNIEPGLNTTTETTQIIRTAMCNIQWPQFESCVEVTFGVPLVYTELDIVPRLTETDLRNMWADYSRREEYADRLFEIGVVEYSVPAEASVMTAWLVIAGGVVISVAMLAFALWRFNCLEDYTRMKAFSDTESIRDEKRGLDLYPTPHQPIPPLYSENEYKWPENDTTVNMGGFANKSFHREDMYDFESDEDVVITDKKIKLPSRDPGSNV